MSSAGRRRDRVQIVLMRDRGRVIVIAVGTGRASRTGERRPPGHLSWLLSARRSITLARFGERSNSGGVML